MHTGLVSLPMFMMAHGVLHGKYKKVVAFVFSFCF
jgi:hypothetical protein